MSAATISLTQSALLTALRSFLLGLYAGEVVQAQDNRVPMPLGSFCTMTAMYITPLSMSFDTYTDPGTNPGTANNQRSTQWRVQLDFYGPGAADSATIIAQTVRTEYACTQLVASGMQPLYASEPKNTTLINAEQQFENRWTVDFIAQFNPIVTTPMDFAAQLDIGLADVDVTFPPE